MPVTVSGFSVILRGRVRETTQTTGTGTYSLDGAPTGKVTFLAGIGAGNNTIYTVESGANYETGIGLVSAGPPATISRALVLESSNSDNAVNWGSGVKDIFVDAAAAVFHGLQNQIDTIPITRTKTTLFPSNGTLTTDPDTVFAWIRIVGGGGAGGGTFATTSVEHAEGAGGGGGEYAEGFFSAAQLGASKTVTIGAGGTAVSGGAGNNGGTTNFGSGLITANGGTGGAVGPAVNGTTQSIGGAGGTGGTGGTFRIQGGRGSDGCVRGTLNAPQWQGQSRGGSSVLAGESGTRQGEFLTGQLYGGGGAGNSMPENSPASSGGVGAAGVCIVVEYLHP